MTLAELIAMTSPLTLNSLITTLFPSQGLGPATTSRPAIAPDSTPRAESGVSFALSEPGRSQANAPPLTYSRRDAMGARQANEAPASKSAAEPDQSAPTGGSAAQAKEDGGQAASPAPDAVKKPNGEFMSKAEMAVLRELQKADQAVKAHELAHLAAAGGYAKGGAAYSYARGPDGQSYAVAGEVQVDTGKESTPEATIAKMQVVRQAALAPADPSPQDQRVAAQATLQIAESYKELTVSRMVQAQAPASPGEQAADGTAQRIYQDAGRDLSQGGSAERPASSRKAFQLYQTPPPSPTRSDRQGVDRIV